MKKLLALTLALLMVLSTCAILASCDRGTHTDESTSESTTVGTEPGTTEAPTTKPTEKETTEGSTEPVTTEPVTTEPVTTEPVTTEPATTEPVTTEPVTDGETTEGAENDIPESGSTLTIKEAMALCELLGNNNYTEGKYYVKGIVKLIYLPHVGGMILSDEDGNTVSINASFNEDGTVGFAQMADKPVVGDEITVYGIIGKSGTTVQMKNVWIIAFGEEETEAPETNAPETEAPETEAPETEAPETEAPETNAPETEAPETTEPETTEPETTEPETTEPETTEPVTTEPETTESETTESETTEPETNEPETTEPETTEPETTETETTEPETTEPETTEPETTEPETTETEAPETETTATETEAPETETTATETEAPETETTATETEKPDAPVIPDDPDTPDETDAKDPENPDGPFIPIDPDVDTEKKPETEQPDSSSCHPRWDYNAGYHWSPACDITTIHPNPKPAGAPAPHTGMCTIEDEGDVLVYTYTCKRCECVIDRIEIPYSVDLYIDAMALVDAKHDFSTMGGSEFTSVDGIPATRYTSIEGKGTYVKVYEDENTSIPTGRYMAIKLKLREGRTSFKLSLLSIEGRRYGGTVSVDISGLNPGWTAVIIDMSKIAANGTGYIPDESGDYYLYTATINMVGKSVLGTNDYFDVAYAAFFNDIDDARELFKDERSIYVYEDALNDPYPTIEGEPCRHEYTHPDSNHHYTDPCDICHDEGGLMLHRYDFISETDDETGDMSFYAKCACGVETDKFTVPENINYFSAPGQIYNNWACYTETKNNGSTVGVTGAVMSEAGVIYTRVGLDNGASLEFTNGTLNPVVRGFGVNRKNAAGIFDDGDLIKGGSGKYIVMKVRCNGLDQLRLIANDGHNQEFYNSGNSFQWFGRSSKEITSGEWTIYVVDLELLASEYYTPNDKSVERVSFGLHFQNNGLSETEDFIEYIDIAYFAVCDDWEEVVSLTGEDQILYTDWSHPGADVMKNPDGTCVKCGVGLLLDEGNKLTFGCLGCKQITKVLTIPEEVNYYSAPSYYYNNWSAGIKGDTNCKPVGDFAYDEDGGVIYSHINTYQGASFEFTNGTCTPDRGFAVNGYTSDSDKVIDAGDKIKGGSGAFMVLKMRATDIEYVDLIVNGDDDEGKLVSSSAVRRSSKDISDDEWTVYVIDIAKLGAEHYAANDATVTNICVALRIDEGVFNASTGVGNGGTESLDIAYFAICDNWAEVASVVGDEEVIYTDWKTPANDKIYTSAGVEACQHDWGAYQSDATTHWKGECSLCGESIAPREHNWKYYKNTRVCNTCGVIERCALNGIHYEITPEGHRVKETCDICRFTIQETLVEHDWEYGPLNRHCTTCKYSEECDGDHYVAEENGHTVKESCAICQIVETATRLPHVWSYGVKSRTCDKCGYVETCDKDHIEFDATGHRIKESCDICQLTKQTEMTEHTNEKGIFITKGETTTTYTYGCTVCGYGEDTWTVDNSINFYSVPGLQVNNYNTGANTGGDTVQGKYILGINEYVDSESGESFLYNRIRFNATGSVKFSNGSTDPSRFTNLTDTIDGSGRFAVLKIRVGGASVGSFFFGAYDGNGNPGSADNVFRDVFNGGYGDRGAGKLPIDKWVTYVIDLTGVNTKYYKAENDKLTKASFGMQIQHGKGGTDTDYIDFAYFAVCDDMEEVAHVVGDDEIEFLKSWRSDSISITCHKGEHNFKDGEYVCQDCGYKVVCEDEDGHFVITATGHRATEDCLVCGVTAQDAEVPHSDFVFDINEGTYSYTCSICGYKFSERVIADDVNYYSAPGQYYNNWASGANDGNCVSVGTLMQDKDGFIYSSINMYQGGSFEFTNGSITPKRGYGVNGTRNSSETTIDPGDTIKGGTGKYFVIKVRTHNIQEFLFLANGDDDNGGAATYTSSATRPTAAIPNEWVVYVVDIEKLGLEHYAANQTAVTNVCVGVQIDQGGVTGGERLDIAYFAICDNWDEVASVVGDEQVLYTNWVSTAGDVLCDSNGNPVGGGTLPEDTEPETESDVTEPETESDVTEPDVTEPEPEGPKLEYVYDTDSRTFKVVGKGDIEGEAIVIPDTYRGKQVSAILDGAFKDTSISSISFGNNVKYIGANAFSGCEDLEISFNGTKKEWIAIEKHNDWCAGVGQYSIYVGNADSDWEIPIQ